MTVEFRFVPAAITVPVVYDYLAPDGSVAQLNFSASFRRLRRSERAEIDRLVAENARIAAVNRARQQALMTAAVKGDPLPDVGPEEPAALTTADLLARTLADWTLTDSNGQTVPYTATALAEVEEELDGLGQAIEIALWTHAWSVQVVKAALEKNLRAPSGASSELTARAS